ncbi:hypothetical protein [Methanoculleus chikugoensis]|uniref:dTMP kinase n=1 Tax=Methanoculleus chikugoensis TaxID=118126 RepID=UPI000AC63334|nr:dTMP kinase [Methanoculleus chikugoensis]
MLITIEGGIDGSGKSTLLARLHELLADLDPPLHPGARRHLGRESVRRAIAERMDPITEALLFCADHAAHIDTLIRPALDEGRLVVSDRYADSRFAYQPVVLDGVLPDPLSWLFRIHEGGWSIRPDRTFLLVLPIEDAVSRLALRKRESISRTPQSYRGCRRTTWALRRPTLQGSSSSMRSFQKKKSPGSSPTRSGWCPIVTTTSPPSVRTSTSSPATR